MGFDIQSVDILPACLVLDSGTPSPCQTMRSLCGTGQRLPPFSFFPASLQRMGRGETLISPKRFCRFFKSTVTSATDRTSKRAATGSTIVTLRRKEVIAEISLSVLRIRRTALSFATSTGTKRACSCLRKIVANHPSPAMNSGYFVPGSMMVQSGLMSLPDTNANAARTGRSNDS